MAEIDENIRNFLIKYKNVILIIWLVLSVVLLIAGAILLNTSTTKIEKTEHKIVYSECKYLDYEDDTSVITCQEYLETHQIESITCFCLINIDVMLKGKVTLYLELPNFDQNSINVNSKDDDQLRGIIKELPSDNCQPFQYDNNKRPIAPCGALADSMLFDNVSDFRMVVDETSSPEVSLLRYGMLLAEDKIGFRNPKNLTYALQNFSKPIHWPKHIYELDLENENNNGFQNEYFISWIRTDWKRKPLARLNQTDDTFREGLPNGSYQFFVKYYTSSLGYNGQRNLIFAAEESIEDTSQRTDGGILLGFGLVMLAAGLIYSRPLLIKLYADKIRRDEEEKIRQNVHDTNPSGLTNDKNNASSPLTEDKDGP